MIIGIDSLRYDIFSAVQDLNKKDPEKFKIGKMYVQSGPTAPSQSTLFSGEDTTERHGYNHGLIERKTTVMEDLSAMGFETLGISVCAWLGRHFGYGRGFDQFVENYPKKSLLETIQILTDDYKKYGRFDEIQKLHQNLETYEEQRMLDLVESNNRNTVMFQDEPQQKYSKLSRIYYSNFKRIFPSIDETMSIWSSLKRKKRGNLAGWFCIQEIHELLFFDPPKASCFSHLIYWFNVIYWRIISRRFVKYCYGKSVKYTLDKLYTIISENFNDYLVIIYSDHGYNLGDFHDNKNAFSSDLKYLTVPLVVKFPEANMEAKSGFEIKSQDFIHFVLDLANSNNIDEKYFQQIDGFMCAHGGPGVLLPNEKPVFEKYIKVSEN